MRVNATALFFPKLRVDFWDTYNQQQSQVDARLGKIMNLNVGSSMASEMYAYMQSAPVARYWNEGDAIPSAGFLSNLFPQRNYKFGIGVEISRTALEDDQTKLAMSRIQDSAKSFAILPERHFYWLLTGGTTVDAVQMQPNLPLAPDGAAWASATDGSGANRFGVSGGNIITSSGVGSPTAIQNDLLNGVARIASFRDTQNQPYWNPGELWRDIVIVFNSVNAPNFQAALSQLFLVASSGQAAPSNVVRDISVDTNLKVTPIPNPRITNNNWAIFAANAPTKAPFWQVRQAPTEVVGEPGNSDTAREWDLVKFYVRMRGAIGLSLPTQCCFVQ